MSEKPISPVRQRMLEDRSVRGFTLETQRESIRAVKRRAAFLRWSPDYFHVVFTLPSAIGDIAYQNKAVVYDLLVKASSEAMLTIESSTVASACTRRTSSRIGPNDGCRGGSR